LNVIPPPDEFSMLDSSSDDTLTVRDGHELLHNLKPRGNGDKEQAVASSLD
jgi:hypothetical protein